MKLIEWQLTCFVCFNFSLSLPLSSLCSLNLFVELGTNTIIPLLFHLAGWQMECIKQWQKKRTQQNRQKMNHNLKWKQKTKHKTLCYYTKTCYNKWNMSCTCMHLVRSSGWQAHSCIYTYLRQNVIFTWRIFIFNKKKTDQHQCTQNEMNWNTESVKLRKRNEWRPHK